MLGPHRLPCETPATEKPRSAAGEDVRWVLPTTMLGSSLAFIDGSVVNVALPAIQRTLGISLTTVQWVVNGYMLTLACLILLGGSAGDRFGRRRIFLIGLFGFAAASLACGLALSAPWLVAARLVQGAAAALLVPASLAIVGAAFTGKARGPAIGTWAAAGAITTALGPPLGGWLVDTIGWRSIFFINLPIAAATLLLALKLPADARTSGETPVEPLDVRGAMLAVIALALLSYGLVALGEGNRTPATIALAAAVPALWLFLREETRSHAPMMPPALFRDLRFTGANVLTVLLYAALSGSLFLLPFMLIDVHGYSAMAAGGAFLPFSLILGGGSRWAGRLVERIGARIPLVLGPSVTAAGYVILGMSGSMRSYWTGFLPGLLVVAVGMTLSIAPLTTTVFDSAPADRSGTASGINNAAARAGGLLAVAALGLAFEGVGGAGTDDDRLRGAYRLVMLAAAVLAALGALVAALTIRTARTEGRNRSIR